MVSGLTDRPDITIAVYHGCETTTQLHTNVFHILYYSFLTINSVSESSVI